MGDVFQAGSVVAQLKTEIDQFNKGFDQANRKMADFGASTERASQTVEKSGTRLSNSIANVERRAALANARVANYTARLLGLQLAIAGLTGGQNSMGSLGKAIESAVKGFQVAAALMYAFPKAISMTGAAFIGAGAAAVDFYANKLRAAIEATDASTASSVKARLSLEELKVTLEDAAKASAVFGATGFEDAQKKLEILMRLFDSNLKRLREIPEEIAAIEQRLSAASDMGAFGLPGTFLNASEIKALQDQLSGLRTERDNRERTNQDITNRAGASRAEVALKQITTEAGNASKALAQMQDIGARSLLLGIAEPAEVAASEVRAAQEEMERILKAEAELRSLLFQPGLTNAQRSEIQGRLNSGDAGAARDRLLAARQNEAAIKEVNSLAASFSESVGSGLRQAILSGQKPMEALATIGGNLFENMVNNLTQKLQTGLESVFKEIAGAGGAGIATALTGALGIVGGILSRRGGSSQSFKPIESRVTSNQAVRGIVAGPTSVSIAQVGEDIGRAFEPSRALLADISATLHRMEGRGSSPRGGSGFAGAVATA